MRVHKKIGSKERFFEMFQNVNKIKLNESFDSPEKKDKKYLDKSIGQKKSNVSKYDDGVRYPVEKELKTKDASLEKLKGDDAPIEESEINDLKKKVNLDNENSDSDMAITIDEFLDSIPSNSDNEEDMLLDPSKHWVNDYTAHNIVTDESLNYPNPMSDPEAGENQYNEMQNINRYDNLLKASKEMAKIYNSGDKNKTLEYIKTLDEVPMIGSSRGGDLGLGHRDLESLRLLRVVRHDDDSYVDNLHDKPIVTLNTRNSSILSVIKPNEREYR